MLISCLITLPIALKIALLLYINLYFFFLLFLLPPISMVGSMPCASSAPHMHTTSDRRSNAAVQRRTKMDKNSTFNLSNGGIEQRTGVKFHYVPVLIGGVFKATNNVSPMVSLEGIKNKMQVKKLH